MTAELGVGLVAVVVVLAALLSVGQAVAAQVRVTDAAAAGARAAARGASEAEAQALATALAGPRATAVVQLGGGRADVVVTAPVDLVLPGAPVVTARGRASAAVEVGVAGAGP
ncbi:TadE family type IV pilus minor pilin [Pseudokineococcus marinus]|uniref:TadE family type IV pilus minor pilin n=1 Tax=Pseudokineococcus marinus TaxID=351215 RepID=UPI0030AFF47F